MGKSLTIYFDGGSRGNPGLGAGAAVVKEDEETIAEVGKVLNHCTNNQAEYTGLICGLEKALELDATEVIAYGDSNLVVSQIVGVYQVKSASLYSYYEKAKSLILRLKSFKINHVKRKLNQEADALCNKFMDEHQGIKKPRFNNNEKVSVNLSGYDLTSQEKSIFDLARKSNRSFKSLMNIKVPPKCPYTRMRLPKLTEQMTESDRTLIEENWLQRSDTLPDDTNLAKLYRWFLRGKKLVENQLITSEQLANFAVHKVRVDLEITENYLSRKDRG